MDNVVGTTSYPGAASDLYPEQNLTATWLHGWTSTSPPCDTCNMIPTPQTSAAYRACDACTRMTQPRHFYKGNDVGPPQQTGTQGYVPERGHYYPESYLRAVADCDLTLLPIERGVNWQSYNAGSQCKQFQA